MKNAIRYASVCAVVCLLFIPTWASDPGGTLSSTKLASLEPKKTYQANNFSVQLINPRIHNPAPASRSQSEPISEPAALLFLGAGMIGLSMIGRKMFKY